MKTTEKLEELFRIEDKAARQKAFVAYARSLRINYLRAKKTDGEYDENELAVLIYTAQETKSVNRLKNSVFLIIGIFLFGAILLAIFFMVRLLNVQ